MGKGPKIAKGKARAFFVLPEKQLERIKIRAIRKKVRPSVIAENLIDLGFKALTEPDGESQSFN